MSTITATVRTVEDAALKFTASGAAIWEVRTAENHQRKDQSGTWIDTGTTWRTVKIIGKRAEMFAEADIRKGTLLLVTGREETRDFEKRDGSKGSAVDLIADQIGIVPTSHRTFRDDRSVFQKATGTYPAPGGTSEPDPWASEPGW